MTSATIKQARSASRGEGIVFAAVLLAVVGFFIAVDVVALWGLCAYGKPRETSSLSHRGVITAIAAHPGTVLASWQGWEES